MYLVKKVFGKRFQELIGMLLLLLSFCIFQVQAIVDHHHPSSEHSASKVRFKEEEPALDSDTEKV